MKLSLVFITTPKKEIDGILKTVFEFVFAQVKQAELKSCIILDFIKVITIKNRMLSVKGSVIADWKK